MGVYVKSIKVEREGNEVFALISGGLSSGHKLGAISKTINNNTVELSITSIASSGISIQSMGRFKRKILLGSLKRGKYAVRINGNNEDIVLFQ